MAFLKAAQVVYYHPFASGLREAVRSVDWKSLDPAQTPASGYLGNGLISAGNVNAENIIVADNCTASGYPRGTFSSATFAVWVSGIGGDLFNAFEAGYYSTYFYHSNAFKVYVEGGTKKSRLGYYENDSSIQWFPNYGPVISTSGWSLLVARIQLDGVNASGDVSVNGAPWQSMGYKSDTSASFSPSQNALEFRWHTGTGTQHRPVDEAIYWLDAPKFTDSELANLYALGATYRQPMTEYSTYAGPEIVKVSGTEVASIVGYNPSLGNFLHPMHALAYLSFENGGYEQINNQTWTGTSTANVGLSGLLGSGLCKNGSTTLACASSGAYGHGTTTDSLTFAVWASGIQSSAFGLRTRNNHYVWAYIGSGSTYLSAFTDNTAYGQNFPTQPGPVTTSSGWSLAVIRMEPASPAGYASGFISINGSDWSGLGTKYLGGFDYTGGDLAFYLSDYEAVHRRPIDEVMIWRGNDRFTPTELSNLYALGATYHRPMSEYGVQYAPWVKASGSTTACASGVGFIQSQASGVLTCASSGSGARSGYVGGFDSASASGTAYVLNVGATASLSGFIQNSSVSTAISGFVSNNQGAASGHTSGFLFCAYVSGVTTAYLYGILAHQRHLFLSCGKSSTGTLPGYIEAGNLAGGLTQTYVRGLGSPDSEGYIPISGAFKLFCKTVPGTHSITRGFVEGIQGPSGYCDAFITGMQAIAMASGDVCVTGYNTSEESLVAYVEAIVGLPTGQVPAFISGVCTPTTGATPLYAHGF